MAENAKKISVLDLVDEATREALEKSVSNIFEPIKGIHAGSVKFTTTSANTTIAPVSPTVGHVAPEYRQPAGPITPELWRHPENATREQLLEMVVKQRAWLIRQRHKSSVANRENEKMREALVHVINLSNTMNMYLGLCIQKESLSWAKRAAYYAKRIYEVTRDALLPSA